MSEHTLSERLLLTTSCVRLLVLLCEEPFYMLFFPPGNSRRAQITLSLHLSVQHWAQSRGADEFG